MPQKKEELTPAERGELLLLEEIRELAKQVGKLEDQEREDRERHAVTCDSLTTRRKDLRERVSDLSGRLGLSASLSHYR